MIGVTLLPTLKEINCEVIMKKILLAISLMVSSVNAVDISVMENCLDHYDIGNNPRAKEGWEVVNGDAYYKVTKRLNYTKEQLNDTLLITSYVNMSDGEFTRFKNKIKDGKFENYLVEYEYFWSENERKTKEVYEYFRDKYSYTFLYPTHFVRFKLTIKEYIELGKKYNKMILGK